MWMGTVITKLFCVCTTISSSLWDYMKV